MFTGAGRVPVGEGFTMQRAWSPSSPRRRRRPSSAGAQSECPCSSLEFVCFARRTCSYFTCEVKDKSQDKHLLRSTWFPRGRHTVEYYSAPKRSEELIHVTTRMSPENMMLSDRRRAHKLTYGVTPFPVSAIGESTEMENRLVVAGVWMERPGSDWGGVHGSL